MNPQGVGPQQVHGIPGTPVGDLFPLGNALLGDGNRGSLRPIRAGELRSHSALSSGVALKRAPKSEFSIFTAKADFQMSP